MVIDKHFQAKRVDLSIFEVLSQFSVTTKLWAYRHYFSTSVLLKLHIEDFIAYFIFLQKNLNSSALFLTLSHLYISSKVDCKQILEGSVSEWTWGISNKIIHTHLAGNEMADGSQLPHTVWEINAPEGYSSKTLCFGRQMTGKHKNSIPQTHVKGEPAGLTWIVGHVQEGYFR